MSGATPETITDAAASAAAIRRMAAEYTHAIELGDRDAFLSFFSDDIVIMPAGQPSMHGRSAAAAIAGALFDQYTMREHIVYDELHVDGDWAAGRFSYTFVMTPKVGGAEMTETGKAMVWLKRNASGAWQFTHWMWSQDQTPSG